MLYCATLKISCKDDTIPSFYLYALIRSYIALHDDYASIAVFASYPQALLKHKDYELLD